jgi:hypothetical protein
LNRASPSDATPDVKEEAEVLLPSRGTFIIAAAAIAARLDGRRRRNGTMAANATTNITASGGGIVENATMRGYKGATTTTTERINEGSQTPRILPTRLSLFR